MQRLVMSQLFLFQVVLWRLVVLVGVAVPISVVVLNGQYDSTKNSIGCTQAVRAVCADGDSFDLTAIMLSV